MKSALFHLRIILIILLWIFPGKLRIAQTGNPNSLTNSQNSLLALPAADIAVCSAVPHFDFSSDLPQQPIAPLLRNIGSLHYEISCANAKTQQFFDQGLRMLYAFNHGEAYRSFREAARLDSSCAMAYWGQALALGPNINDVFPNNQRYREAWLILQKAKQYMHEAKAKERALIRALMQRYGEQIPPDISRLNQAYSQAMQKLARQYRDDPEIQVLYVASLMNTMPWDYYTETHHPKAGVEEGIERLQKVIAKNPDHPGAHHYLIHLVEAENPQLAENSADQLGQLMPAAGHLVHMPSHIYIRLGRYHDATLANIKAIDADLDYIAQCRAQNIYKVIYYPHNYHFLWATASMEGNSELAIQAAETVPERLPRDQVREFNFMQEFLSIPYFAYVRFGKWREILGRLQPEPELLHANAIWHYARGMAYANTEELSHAHQQLHLLDSMRLLPEMEELYGNFTNTSLSIATLARNVLAAEIARQEEQWDEALKLLSLAVEQEDKLNYIEPPAWAFPVRHQLGALLLEMDRPQEAEKVYRADLSRNPKNGWALFGLWKSLEAQDKRKEARVAKADFDEAWKGADVQLHASRF